MSCFQRTEKAFGSFFEKIGHLISEHPWKIIIIVILINGLLGIGMLEMKQDINVGRVYTPMNSQAIKDEESVKTLFPDKSGENFYSHQLVIEAKSASVIFKPYSGNILNRVFLEAVKSMDSFIANITITDEDGSSARYTDLCARRNGNCVTSGQIFLSDAFENAVDQNLSITYPMFENENYRSIVAQEKVVNGTLLEAKFMKIQYNLRSDTSEHVSLAEKWQEQFLTELEEYSSSVFDFAYAHSDSLSVELNANIGGDIGLFSATFTLMIVYACFAAYSAKHDCIGNQAMLGLAGVLGAGLGIVASFGLVSACGVSFVSIVGNSPFLIIGIGVDDMFILLSGLADTTFDTSVKTRIGSMLRKSGVAITITSLTDIIAFGAGASSSFKSIRNFCIYTGVAVMFCYINQLFLFSACLALNEKRVNTKRHFICCRPTKSKEQMVKDGETSGRIICCAGERPMSREDVEGFPEKVPRKILARLVTFLPAQVIILLAFCGYILASVYGTVHLQQGLIVSNLVADDSYYFKYRTWQDGFFSSNVPISFVVNERLAYSSPDTQQKIDEVLETAQANQFIDTSPSSVLSWLTAYKSDTINYDDSTEINFIAGLSTFLNAPQNQVFRDDVVISGNTITTSRFYVFTEQTLSSQDQGQVMLDMRDIAKGSSINLIAFSPSFVFFEQYVAILPQTLQTLGISVAAVFVITTIFMPHIIMLLLVVVSMVMIITGIVGFMYYWNLTLSSITMIHLIMSVGFSVDFTAHVCHAYIVSNDETRKERVMSAMALAGGPIFNGAVSSIIGIVMLAFAKSYIFKSFFKVMLLVILFGAIHALFLLPVVLSLIGPNPKSVRQESDSNADGKHSRSDLTLNKISVRDSNGHKY